MFITILLFILILGLLILSHEFGHFYAAKKSGMRVDEFGFGFPPRLFSKKKGETTYSFNLLPIGGFVKIYGEEGEAPDDERSFAGKSIRRRSLVIVAGVLMNVILAYFLFSAGHVVGTPALLSDDEVPENVSDVAVQIARVFPDTPAEEAGLETGDRVTSVSVGEESVSVSTISELQDFIENHKGEDIMFSVVRGDATEEISVFARSDVPENEGATGIQLVRVGIAQEPVHTALWEGAKTTYRMTEATVFAFGNIISRAATEGEVPQEVAGPVGIAVMTGTVRDLGVSYVIQFIALISLNLAILNIIPFPALDGGRLGFLIAEKLKGSPVSKKVEGIVHAVGFTALIILIIFITFHDVTRFL